MNSCSQVRPLCNSCLLFLGWYLGVEAAFNAHLSGRQALLCAAVQSLRQLTTGTIFSASASPSFYPSLFILRTTVSSSHVLPLRSCLLNSDGDAIFLIAQHAATVHACKL
jgi:hypothetical protein